MRIEWTRRAERELEEKVDWLALNRPGASAPFLKRIREAVRQLPRFPQRGRRLPDLPDEPVREVVAGTYRIVYLPEEERILIVTLKHCSEEMTDADLRPELPWPQVSNE